MHDAPHYRPVWLAVVLGLVVTALATAAVQQWERRNAEARRELQFYSAGNERLATVKRHILRNLDVVEATRAFFHASRSVTREEFGTFAGPLIADHPGIRALEWVPRVRASARETFEAAARRTHPGFRIKTLDGEGALVTAPPQSEYFPVYYVEPRAGNAPVLGLDLGSEPERRATLEFARDRGRAVATGRLSLGSGVDGGQEGVLVFTPLYEQETVPETVPGRREALRGFILAVLAPDRLVEHALADLPSRGIDIWVYDMTAPPGTDLLYRRAAPGVAEPRSTPEPQDAWTQVKQRVPLAGRGWALVAAPAPGRFLPYVPNAHWVTLGAGLAITALLAAYLFTAARTSAARARNERQLRRLNRAYAVLSASNQALIRTEDERALLDTCCRNAVDVGGYRMAWVGFAEHDADKTIRPVAWAGHEAGYTTTLNLTWADDPERGHGPMGRAIRESRPVPVQDIGSDPTFVPWRSEARARGYASVIALPLSVKGQVLGALAIYSDEPDAFDPSEVELLSELADDLAFGILSLRTKRERDRAELGIRLRNRAIESSVDGMVITDARESGYPIVYVNPAFTRITGYSREEAVGRRSSFLQGEDLEQVGLEKIRAALRQRREGSALLRSYRKDRRLFWNELHVAPVRDDEGNVSHFVGVINDVTEQVRYREQLEHQANHDQLTGLANRNLLQDRLQQAIAHASRHGSMTGVVMLDLDRFKKVNDSLGHESGDELLRCIADRALGGVRAGDTVARQGGDEFVLVLPDVTNMNEITAIAHRMLEAVKRPVPLGEHEIDITASLGISVYPRDGETVEALLKNADAAMYQAKEQAPGSFRFYQASMNERALARLTLERRMRRALDHGEFMLHYQPQGDLRSGRIVGMEALVRWRQSDGDMVSPGEFIPLAEETGLIVPLGEWVLREACRQVQAWEQAGLPAIRVGVNISARQFHQEDLFETVVRMLRDARLAPGHLELELTESLLMRDPEHVISTMRRLKEFGVHLALDDFGTGYSSLAYLKRFPINRVKIDRSFVRSLPEDADDAAIAVTIISMAHHMGLKVIAEGVETSKHLRFLRKHGCDEIQGYYLGRPTPADEAGALLHRKGSRALANIARRRARAPG